MATPATIPVLAEIGDVLLNDYDGTYRQYAPIGTRYTQVLNADRTPETIQPVMYFGELVNTAIGGPTTYQDPAEAYKSTVDITNAKRALGFLVSEEAVMVDRSGRLRRAAQRLGTSSQHTKETIMAGTLNNGFTTNHAARAKPLFDDANPLFGGGTFDNKISGDLAIATFESATIQFANFVDDRGLKINVAAKYLVHTPNDRRVAKQILGSEKEPFSADNQMNVYRGFVEAVENPWLTDLDSAFLLSAAGENGIALVQWQDTRRKAWVDEDVDALKFKATYVGAMVTAGYDFRGAVGILGV